MRRTCQALTIGIRAGGNKRPSAIDTEKHCTFVANIFGMHHKNHNRIPKIGIAAGQEKQPSPIDAIEHCRFVTNILNMRHKNHK